MCLLFPGFISDQGSLPEPFGHAAEKRGLRGQSRIKHYQLQYSWNL